MPELIDHKHNQGHDGNSQTNRNHIRKEPVILFSLVENKLQETNSDYDESHPEFQDATYRRPSGLD